MEKTISKSRLAIILSQLEQFSEPKVMLEQYPTDPEIAAEVLWNAYMHEDIYGKVIADLGCGTGILGLGALLLGASHVVLVDIDEQALNLAKKNYSKLQSEYSVDGTAEFHNQDVSTFNKKGDTVIENPPFGVKRKHADRMFLSIAVKTAPIIYTLHKSESTQFINSFAGDNGLNVSHEWRFSFPLKRRLSYHTRKIHRIQVSCYRLERKSF
jgi:putative methylase